MTTNTRMPLGSNCEYIDHYQADCLFPIARQSKREELGVKANHLPFLGWDVWNAYELSWLNAKGKPQVALAEIIVPCESPYIIESKSMKLYLNSFNQTHFEDFTAVKKVIERDLGERVGLTVAVKLHRLRELDGVSLQSMQGVCLDELDVMIDTYQPTASLIECYADTPVEETVYSNLLKSNCLVTSQPDWASVRIAYSGNQIDHASLLKYIVSFRNHNEFHEQCVERIFVDIMQRARPKTLTVEARYTRRGGIDINPMRTTQSSALPSNYRLVRQ